MESDILRTMILKDAKRVDGRDLTYPVDAEIRPHFRDSNRYHGFVSLKRVFDRHKGSTSIAVAQALGRSPDITGPFRDEFLRYRVLLVSANGQIAEDLFTYEE